MFPVVFSSRSELVTVRNATGSQGALDLSGVLKEGANICEESQRGGGGLLLAARFGV